MTDPNIKGSDLERAVEIIERHILSPSPNVNEGAVRIESRKIITVSGVRHEIDIYVEATLAPGYTSVFLFECKNWEQAVGKNEIIVFSEKINACRAQKGFFVARSFSRDAEAQASKDPRIELVIATAEDPASAPLPFEFHYLAVDRQNMAAEVRGINPGATERVPIDFKQARFTRRGEAIDMEKFILAEAQKAINARTMTFPSGRLPDGSYELEAATSVDLAPENIEMDGKQLSKLELKIDFTARVERPAVISQFKVGNRVRSITFAPTKFSGATLQMAFVQVPQA